MKKLDLKTDLELSSLHFFLIQNCAELDSSLRECESKMPISAKYNAAGVHLSQAIRSSPRTVSLVILLTLWHVANR